MNGEDMNVNQQEEDAVEAFVLPNGDSTKPVVMSSLTSSQNGVSAAKRRWKLLKTMTKVSRQTSLTLKEVRMMKALEKSSRASSAPAAVGETKMDTTKATPPKEDATAVQDGDEDSEVKKTVSWDEDDANKVKKAVSWDNDDDKEKKVSFDEQDEERKVSFDAQESAVECSIRLEARRELRKSIALRSRMLTRTETTFLEDLADAEDVEVEDLEQAAKVLHNDPLYQVPQQESRKSRRRLTILPEPSYRKELWTTLQAEGSQQSEERLVFMTARGEQLEEEKNKAEDFVKVELSEVPKARKRDKWGSFVYKFQKAFHLDEEDDKEEATEVMDEEDFMDPVTFQVLATSIPDLVESGTVLSPPIMDALRAYLPYAVQQDNFWCKYSMAHDGASMYVLLNKIRNSARTFFAIETDQGDVFGSFTSSPWRVQSRGYYGSCEAFLWRLKKSRYTPCESVEDQIKLESDVEVFEWSRNNRNIQAWSGMEGELNVGGGDYDEDAERPGGEEEKDFGSGFTITTDLEKGFTEKCLTFNSPPLAKRAGSGGVFNIANIEVWTLTPVSALEEAEKLELGRQFVFDHGGFCTQ